MNMAKGVFLAWTSPVSPDRLAEFDEWYRETHIPQVRAAVPSISAATRYELIDPAADQPSYRYLTVYELDDADVPAAAAAMNESAAAGKIDMTPAIDLAERPPAAEWYRAYPG
jgi:hypothetical protein